MGWVGPIGDGLRLAWRFIIAYPKAANPRAREGSREAGCAGRSRLSFHPAQPGRVAGQAGRGAFAVYLLRHVAGKAACAPRGRPDYEDDEQYLGAS